MTWADKGGVYQLLKDGVTFEGRFGGSRNFSETIEIEKNWRVEGQVSYGGKVGGLGAVIPGSAGGIGGDGGEGHKKKLRRWSLRRHVLQSGPKLLNGEKGRCAE